MSDKILEPYNRLVVINNNYVTIEIATILDPPANLFKIVYFIKYPKTLKVVDCKT